MNTKMVRFISIDLWGNLPSPVQRGLSSFYAKVYDKKISRHFIKPYCRYHYEDKNYLDQFEPASGSDKYQSFQDFFTRVFKTPPSIDGEAVWACEGLLCEFGKVSELNLVKVKGQKRHLRTIFGNTGSEIPDDYYYSNIFLHNNNYHRIHAPISGTITKIERIAGDLVLLRPWAYTGEPSLPALRNERVNVDIVDQKGRKWFMSIVGGPAVGTIVMTKGAKLGYEVEIGGEIAKFLLGSTCCIASPIKPKNSSIGKMVEMGEPIN